MDLNRTKLFSHEKRNAFYASQEQSTNNLDNSNRANGSQTIEESPNSGADFTAADVNVLSRIGEDVENLLESTLGETIIVIENN